MLRSPRSLYAYGILSAAIVVYLAYVCFTKNYALRDMEVRLERMVRTRDQVTAQLQVVTDHRQRLEQSIEDYKSKLQILKEESQKQRDNLEAAADYANRRMQEVEKAMEAARLDYRRAVDQLRKVKDDEIQRLQESLAAQRRWCQQLQEKFDAEYVQPKSHEGRSLQVSRRISGHAGVPAATVAGNQMVGGGGAVRVRAAAVDDSVQLMQRGQLDNRNNRWPAAVQPGHEDGYAGQRVAKLSAAEDEAMPDVRGEQSSLHVTRKINMEHVGVDAADDVQQRAVAPAQPFRGRDDYLKDRADDADREAVVGEYSERHRRRLHDADEIAGDLRELSANAIHSPDRVSDEVGNEDATV